MSITDLVDIPNEINKNVSAAKQITMKSILGSPRESYNDDCQDITNEKLRNLIISKKVGLLKVTGLKPAVESLGEILIEIQQKHQEIYDSLNHIGILCARLVRGSSSSISNHSWGTAIDLTLNNQLDTRRDNKVQTGLTLIAPIFNNHGWFWGAGFRIEDGMHFEVSDEKMREWFNNGIFNELNTSLPEPMLSIGDRGTEVVGLQEKLNKKGSNIKVDGVFGITTQTEVMAFQAKNNLQVDGIVGIKTWNVLNL
jgi:hypothetical protein